MVDESSRILPTDTVPATRILEILETITMDDPKWAALPIDADGLHGFMCCWDGVPDPARPNQCQFRSTGWPTEAMMLERAAEHQKEHETGRMVAIWSAKVQRRLELYYSARDDAKEQALAELKDAQRTLEEYQHMVTLMTELHLFKKTRGWEPWLTVDQYRDSVGA